MDSAVGLPPGARLRHAGDFAALRNAPGRLDTRYFLIRYRISDGPLARLGLAVSRRVSKSAVKRNRIKRLARESFRGMRARMPPLDVLVIARPPAVEIENAALRADLQQAWLRLRALKRGPAPGTIAD